MKKILKENPNTKEHWDSVYTTTPFLGSDGFRYSYLALQLEDKPCLILDLGCGTGQGCSEIKKHRMFSDITGVDFSPLAIDEARLKNPYIKFICADVTDTKLPPNSFDYVVSSETLEHLDNPQSLVDEMYRLTKDMVILTTPLLDRVPSGEHIYQFDLKDVEQMFTKAGFKEVYVYPWASQRFVQIPETKHLVYPVGNLDTIVAIGRRR